VLQVNSNQFDEQLKKSVNRYTNVNSELKRKTWEGISEELFIAPRRRKKRKRILVGSIASVATIALLIFGFMTETGQAMIQDIKELFVEEKNQEIELEGHKEEMKTQLETNEELRYIIYIDEDRYKLIEGQDGDRVEPKEPLGENYPEVYMEISKESGVPSGEIVKRIKTEIDKEGLEIVEEETVNNPISSTMLRGIGRESANELGKVGNQWDTPVHRYYVTEQENGQVFVIKQAYFLEAAEGHGARFNYMLESFKVVK
jgi:hypothetical protein